MEEIKQLEKRVKSLEEAFAKMQLNSLLPLSLQDMDEFENLKMLLYSDLWPAAIDNNLICKLDSIEEKNKRANIILDTLLDIPLEHLKFLDFGCGEGHVVQNCLRQNPNIAVGYDIVHYPYWDSVDTGKALFTDTWQTVVENGPYNVILLYDSIDHIEGGVSKIIQTLIDIKSVLVSGGHAYVRCHPWCSKHATHLYHQLNKAYLHLVFTDLELEQLRLKSTYTQQVLHPHAHYEKLFRKAGFKMLRRGHIIQEKINPFFIETPLVAKRIKIAWTNSPDNRLRNGMVFPEQISLQFVDYVLT